MSFWNFCFGWLGSDDGAATVCSASTDDSCVNPANGLPMMGGMGGVDVEGNPWGTDSHDEWHNDAFVDTSSILSDDGGSCSAWQDDAFGSSWSHDD